MFIQRCRGVKRREKANDGIENPAFAQNVDKSGKNVDNRVKMCKSAFENFMPVLPEWNVMPVYFASSKIKGRGQIPIDTYI